MAINKQGEIYIWGYKYNKTPTKIVNKKTNSSQMHNSINAKSKEIYTTKLLNSTVCAISSVMPLFPAISATAGSPRFIFLADIHLITYPPSSNSATPSRNQLLGGDAQFPWRFNPIIFVSWCIK